MKLYSIQASNNCRRVNAVIQHLGLEGIEIIEQPMGELKAPHYLAVNPNGKVPSLVDGDLHLWEGRAIMQYLAARSPESGLWPADEKRRADIARWQFWEASHLAQATGTFTFQNLFKKIFMKQEPDAALVASATKDFHLFAPVLNTQLEGKKYLLGDTLTLADFSVAACFSFADPAGIPWNDYKHIKSWYGRLDEIPAWKNTAPKLG